LPDPIPGYYSGILANKGGDRFIQARFGAVPSAVEQRIAADRATLDWLVARAAVVPTVDDL